MTVFDLMTVESKPERRQCAATSRQTGQPCGATPAPGFTVCKWHGGRAPQVKAKAEERLKALVDPAITKLEELLNCGMSPVELAAVKDVLDRAGYKPKEHVALDVQVVKTLGGGVDPGAVV